MAKLRDTIYYEFYEVQQNFELFKGEGFETLGTTTIETGIDTIPVMSFTIPISCLPPEVLTAASEDAPVEYDIEPKLHSYVVKVHIHSQGEAKYVFQGIVSHIELDYANYSVSITLQHRVARMQRWAMPINYTVKNTTISHALGQQGAALGYETDPNNPQMQLDSENPQVTLDYEDGYASDVTLEMTFGSNNKLAALTEALENTPDLHFYVDLEDAEGDRIVIGRFGDYGTGAPRVIVSPYPEYTDECNEIPEAQYVTMLTEPSYDVVYDTHANRAVVFCGDIQDGVCHLTLEQIYNDPSLQVEGFPVGKYEYELNLQPDPEYDENGKKINNEKIYQDYDIVAYTKNGNREFYVEDSEQLARDGGIVLHTTYQFNDLYPIPRLQTTNEEGEKIEMVITDNDRIEITKRAYQRAVRKLKAQRPERVYQMNTTSLPKGTRDGQYILFTYSKKIRVPDPECENEFTERKIVNINANLYLTKRTITFDSAMNEVTTITLDHELRTRDTTAAEWELKEIAASDTDGDGGNGGAVFQQSYPSGISDTRTRQSAPRSSSGIRRI